MSAPTLGWLALEFIQELPSPSDPTRPFVLIEPQADFVLDFYSFDPTTLEFPYRRGALMWPKGRGKSPLAAAMALFEFAGPAIPDGFDGTPERKPVGRPWGTRDRPAPWVQIAALAEEQASSNVFSLLYEMLSLNDGKVAQALGIDEGKTRLFRKDRPSSKLEAVTSSAGAREGQRTTFAVCDESHLWTPTNGGVKLARTLRRNAGKTNGRTIEFTNAPELGEGSVAEMTLHDHEAGEDGILLHSVAPSIEPRRDMSDAQLSKLLGEVYDETPWIDTRRILREVRDPATGWPEAVRYYFNLPSAGASRLADPKRWDELAVERQAIKPRSPVWLGFDGSHSSDGTAIVGVTEAGHLWLPLLIERQPHDSPEWVVPRELVHETLAELFERFKVGVMFCDPYHWEPEFTGWQREYGEDRVVRWPTNSYPRFGPSVDRFRASIEEGHVSHDGDADLRRHVLNARLLKGRSRSIDDGHALHILTKPGHGRLIDAATAATLALEARAKVPAPPSRKPLIAWG